MKELEVQTRAYEDYYYGGKLAQQAFPGMAVGDRELLISGTCSKCFDELFPPEEGGEG